MINAFEKSRRTALLGGIVLGAGAGAGAWFALAGQAGGLPTRLLLAALAAFVGVNIALYAARLFATKEYQSRLLYLYEELDPEKFLTAMEPLKQAKLDASNRCTTLVHIANGLLYAGRPEKALETLESIAPPEKALEMRGLVLSNKATCWLAQGNADRAQMCMDELRPLLADKRCNKEFSVKAHYTLAYLQLCMDIQRKKRVDTQILEKDFESSRSPFHKLDVQYRLALAYRRAGDVDACARARAYVEQHGAKTALPGLLEEKN